MKTRLLENIRFRLAVILGEWLLRFIYGTNRWQVEGERHYQELLKQGKSVIIAVWHGQLLAVFMQLARKQFHALVGTHRDAELIAEIGERMGTRFLRGSSTERGTAAFKEIVKVLKKPGSVVAITPDGPKGPARIPKPGTIRAAQMTGVAIVPAVAQSTRRWEFTNWDTFFVAKPFGRIEVIYGEPIFFARDEDYQLCIEKLKEALDSLSEEVEKRVQS